MSRQTPTSKPSFWILAIALLACGTLIVVAAPGNDEPDQQRPRRGHRQGPGQMMRRPPPMFQILRDLDLTADQRDEVRSIMQAAHQKRRAFMQEHKDELQALDEQIRKLVQQRRKLMSKALDRDALIEQISGVLTEQQQSQLKEQLKSMRDREGAGRRSRFNRRGPGGDRPRHRSRGQGQNRPDDADRHRRPRRHDANDR